MPAECGSPSAHDWAVNRSRCRERSCRSAEDLRMAVALDPCGRQAAETVMCADRQQVRIPATCPAEPCRTSPRRSMRGASGFFAARERRDRLRRARGSGLIENWGGWFEELQLIVYALQFSSASRSMARGKSTSFSRCTCCLRSGCEFPQPRCRAPPVTCACPRGRLESGCKSTNLRHNRPSDH